MLPWLFFDSKLDVVKEVRLKQEKLTKDKDQYLYCSVCGQIITSTKHSLSIHGSHIHSCTNPHGIDYRIGCFYDAEGCSRIGQPTTEFTWFANYLWTMALCIRCASHVGWHFHKTGENFFYGLILNRLTDDL